MSESTTQGLRREEDLCSFARAAPSSVEDRCIERHGSGMSSESVWFTLWKSKVHRRHLLDPNANRSEPVGRRQETSLCRYSRDGPSPTQQASHDSSEACCPASGEDAIHGHRRLLGPCLLRTLLTHTRKGLAAYYSHRNQFERFRGFLELISRFEFDFRRRGIFFLNDSNFLVCSKFNHTQCGRACACAVASLCPQNSNSNVVVSVTIHDDTYMYTYIFTFMRNM